MKKFPKTMYVVQEQDGENCYFVASDDPSTFAETGTAIKAAEYKLVRDGVIIETTVTIK